MHAHPADSAPIFEIGDRVTISIDLWRTHGRESSSIQAVAQEWLPHQGERHVVTWRNVERRCSCFDGYSVIIFNEWLRLDRGLHNLVKRYHAQP